MKTIRRQDLVNMCMETISISGGMDLEEDIIKGMINSYLSDIKGEETKESEALNIDQPLNLKQVKSFEDIKRFSGKVIQSKDSKQHIAFKKLELITETLNEGWKPDWTDRNQKTYYPYFDLSNSCSFDGVFYLPWSSNVMGSARLVFKTKELAEFAGKTFQDLYKDLLTD